MRFTAFVQGLTKRLEATHLSGSLLNFGGWTNASSARCRAPFDAEVAENIAGVTMRGCHQRHNAGMPGSYALSRLTKEIDIRPSAQRCFDIGHPFMRGRV
jgi:hypothetical protein